MHTAKGSMIRQTLIKLTFLLLFSICSPSQISGFSYEYFSDGCLLLFTF